MTTVDQSTTQQPSGKAPRPRLLPLLIAMTAVGPTSLNIVVPAIPGLVQAFKTDTGTVQLAISLYLVGLAFSQLLLGPLSDRFGRRPVVLAGFAFTAVTSLLALGASTIGELIVARTAQALGASTGLVLGRAIIRDLYERDQAAAMIGLVTSAMVVAPMVAPLFGGLLDTAFGWESIFIAIAVFSILVLAWAALTLPETRPHTAGEVTAGRFWNDLRNLAVNANFNAYMLVGSLASGSFFSFLGGAPHVVVTLMGRSSAEYGFWFIINSIGYMSGTYTASRLSMRYGIDSMIRWGLLIQLVGCVISVFAAELFFAVGPAILFVPQVLVSFGNGVVVPNAVAGAVSVNPNAAGTASGITGFAQMAVGAAIVQFTGWALTGASTALPMTLTMLAVTFVGAALFVLLAGRSGRKTG